MIYPLQPLLRYARPWLLLTLLAGSACSSPARSDRQPPADPAADSVADGLIESDTLIDDDTLEITLSVRPQPRK